jgi:hypothetical protein
MNFDFQNEQICTMRHSGDECRLACAAQSQSHVCDDATKQCRSTCGLYDNNGSAAEVLQGLSDALPPKMPLKERLARSSHPYVQIIVRFKKLGRDLRPRSFSILVPRAGFDAFAENIDPALDRLFEPATFADEGKAVVQFSLLPASVQRIQSNASPEQMLSEATEAILRAFPDR